MTEDALPRIRIVASGASVLLCLTVVLGTASAQSATAGSAGKPLPLLQFVHPRSKAKPRPHHRLAAHIVKKKAMRQRVVKRILAKPHHVIADARHIPARAESPKNIWPAADTATPGGMAGIAPNQVPAVTTEPVVETDPNQIVPGGHSVQAALPNGLNQTDVASGEVEQAAKTMAAETAAPKPLVHAMVVKADAGSVSPPSPMSNTSWITHVLVALGGALTAGAVAWFLIRPAPGRTYG